MSYNSITEKIKRWNKKHTARNRRHFCVVVYPWELFVLLPAALSAVTVLLHQCPFWCNGNAGPGACWSAGHIGFRQYHGTGQQTGQCPADTLKHVNWRHICTQILGYFVHISRIPGIIVLQAMAECSKTMYSWGILYCVSIWSSFPEAPNGCILSHEP